MSGLAERNGGRVGLVVLAVILPLGLGLRVGEAWDGRAPVFDAAAYAEIARNLDDGDGLRRSARTATQPASNYSPGLPLFAAGIYELTGGVHERTARLVLALLGTLAVLFTYLIGRRSRGPSRVSIGAGAIAIYPALLEYQGMLMGEPLAATLLSGCALGASLARSSGRRESGAVACATRGWWLARSPFRRAGTRPPGVPRARLARELGGARQGLARSTGANRSLPCSDPAGWSGDRRRALDGAQRGRARSVRADLDRRRPGALRRHLPAFRRRSGKGAGQRWSSVIPELFAPGAVRAAAARADPGSAGREPLSADGNRRGPRPDGAGTALGRRHRRAGRVRGVRRHEGRADLGARAAGRDAPARLGAAALGAGRSSGWSA